MAEAGEYEENGALLGQLLDALAETATRPTAAGAAITRRSFLGGIVAASGLLRAGHARADPPPAVHGDRPSVHGMVLMGDRHLYLSHLPLFHAPHDYQVILEATLPAKALETYRQDRAATKERLYTIEPERFVLPTLADASGARRSFRATIVRGHFERGGTEVAKDVEVTVARIVHFRKLDPAAERPPRLTYLLYGAGADLFLAHRLVRPPDFDQIVSVGMRGPAPAPEALRAGLTVTADRADTWDARLTAGELPVTAEGKPLRLALGAEVYAEAEELKA